MPLILARLALMLDLALLMGLPLFWWAMGTAGSRAASAALAMGGLSLSVLWLLAIMAAMTGAPMLPPDWAAAQIVLEMTPIGPVLAVRGVALVMALMLALTGRTRLVLLPAAIAAATLAWTGHAAATEGLAGSVHRVADVAHIWAASGWIGALAALLFAAIAGRPSADLLAHFSLFGTLFVATLVVSGVVNGAMILDLDRWGSLYGWLLVAKLALFIGMLGLAAVNRWRLTPALARGDGQAALRLSLLLETGAAISIVALVAGLGTLDPAG